MMVKILRRSNSPEKVVEETDEWQMSAMPTATSSSTGKASPASRCPQARHLLPRGLGARQGPHRPQRPPLRLRLLRQLLLRVRQRRPRRGQGRLRRLPQRRRHLHASRDARPLRIRHDQDGRRKHPDEDGHGARPSQGHVRSATSACSSPPARCSSPPAFKPDGVFLGGDIAYKNGMLFSPDMHRELVFPYLKRIIDYFKREHGLSSSITATATPPQAIPLLLEAGIDCLEPLEVNAGMDVRKLAKEWGSKLAFMGNISVADHVRPRRRPARRGPLENRRLPPGPLPLHRPQRPQRPRLRPALQHAAHRRPGKKHGHY